MKISTRVALAVAAASLISSTTHAALQLVVKNTDSPGIGSATWAASPFLNSSIDQSGNVAFRATLTTGVGGVLATDNQTAWYGAPGSLNLYARTGNPGPGLAGVNITAITGSNVGLSPNGTLYFAGSTAAPNGYIATGSVSGGFTKVARNGDVLPGVGGVAINSNPSGLGYHFVNNAGQTLAFSSLTGDASAGLWVGNGSNLQLAYQTGQSYAGLPTGGTPRDIRVAMINGSGSSYVSFVMNNAGSIDTNNNEVLTTLPFGSSTFTVVAREFDVAPGTGGANYLRGLFNAPLNSDNQVFFAGNGNYNNLGHSLFSTGLEGTGVVGTTNNAAMFYYDGTAVQLFRRRGDLTTAVSGATLAFTSGAVPSNARLNNNDNVAWTTSLTAGVGGVTTSNDAVLLSTQVGSSSDTLVAREGSAVPVVPGALFGTSFGNLLQNNANQLIFSTTLLDDPNNANDNVTTTNDLALFGWNSVGGYSLIAREGDDLSSIGINMTLTGSWLNMFNTANTEGGAYALTDNGWLTFRVGGTALPTFTDNAAIVRTQIPIPEPGTLTMLAAVGALALRRRRAV